MKGAWNPYRTQLCGGVGGLCQPKPSLQQPQYLSAQQGCLYSNHTSDTPSPLRSVLFPPHASCRSQEEKGGGIGEYIMTTYRMASWLNIAKPLWLRLNCACCALHLLSKQEACLSSIPGHRGGDIPVSPMWGRCGTLPAATVTNSCWFRSALEV